MKHLLRNWCPVLVVAAVAFLCSSCAADDGAAPPLYDAEYLLSRLPNDYYHELLEGTFPYTHTQSNFITSFEPFGHAVKEPLQYTHRYAGNCIYHACDTCIWKFAEIEFPHSCLTRKPVYAKVALRNATDSAQLLYLRLFYQNTSYWWNVNHCDSTQALDNFYGASQRLAVLLPPHTDTLVLLPWKIAMDPKNTRPYYEWRVPAAAGNYETMLLAGTDTNSLLLQSVLPLQQINPFRLLTWKKEGSDYSYVRPEHFKLVMLDEKFDGSNYLAAGRYYIAEDHKQKPLCDTCSGYFADVVSESWTADDFYKGFIRQAPYIKAEYGNRKELCTFSNAGIALKIPARDSSGRKTKTWGEVIFGPTFRYGHLTVRARFAQMMNPTQTPNGIIHNLWLFQRDAEDPDTSNPYHYLRNYEGLHRYEIDFEIWSSYGEQSLWDDRFLIDYSIVDYMRDASVQLKPGEEKTFGKYKADRHNGRQCNIVSPEMNRHFFNDFHTYEIIWKPASVQFKLDGKEVAYFTPNMAKIPDRQMYLWIGSPIYQDGTLYTQSSIPFLLKDKETIIDYIRIE